MHLPRPSSPVCSFWIQGLDGTLYLVASGINPDVVKNIQLQYYIAEKQYGTTMAGLPSSVVAGHALRDHGAETPPLGTSLFDEAALPVPALTPAQCLRWPLLLLLLRHRKCGFPPERGGTKTEECRVGVWISHLSTMCDWV